MARTDLSPSSQEYRDWDRAMHGDPSPEVVTPDHEYDEEPEDE